MATPKPQCKWCSKEFKTTGALGRHYDVWVYRRVGPPPEDNYHTPEAVEEMRILRQDVKRRPAYRNIEDKRAARAQQNRESYARNQAKFKSNSREKRDSLVARHMVVYEMEMEGLRRLKNYQPFNINPDSALNFATLVFHFLPRPRHLLPDLGPEDGVNPGRCWGIRIPSRREYISLCLLLHPDRNPQLGNAWMQRLTVEWALWEELDDTEKLKQAIEELGRALLRQELKARLLEPTGPSTIKQRIAKWEARIREIRLSGQDTIRLCDLEAEVSGQSVGEGPEMEMGDEMVNDTELTTAGTGSDGTGVEDII